MADEHMVQVEVLSPEGEVFSGELRQVSTRTEVGEIGILARHVPMVARLVPTELRLIDSNGEVTERYAQGEGWLEVFANQARLLVSEVVAPDDLDTSELESRLEDAKSTLDQAEEDSTEYETAEREKLRAEAFLKIAKGD